MKIRPSCTKMVWEKPLEIDEIWKKYVNGCLRYFFLKKSIPLPLTL
jgi:hypothetical protein